tara:strand:- start:292 stop:1467 length:1176 start_codon:yes stop_codon:yes gene_type:complete
VKFLKFFFSLIITVLSTGCVAIPFNEVPKPTGDRNIGTESVELIDIDRLEWFTEDPQDLRKIMIQIWYPTDDLDGEKESYIDYGELRIEALASQFDYSPFLFKKLIDVETNSIRKAEPSTQSSFPLIIFSHGLGGNRTQNTIMIEELTSHGYVVIAIEHAYDANISIFNNGDVADYRSGINYQRRNTQKITPEEFWAIRLPQLETRAKDVSYIIDQLELGNLPENIINIIDLENIGVFGHSFGGATSIYSTYNDHRIDACINLDGWMVVVPDEIVDNGINRNFMYLGQEQWDEKLNYQKLDKFIKSNTKSSKILIPNTTHYDFSDTPHMSKAAKFLNKSGKVKSKNLKNLLNELIISFFNQNLKNQKIIIDYPMLAKKHEIDLIVEEYIYE